MVQLFLIFVPGATGYDHCTALAKGFDGRQLFPVLCYLDHAVEPGVSADTYIAGEAQLCQQLTGGFRLYKKMRETFQHIPVQPAPPLEKRLPGSKYARYEQGRDLSFL